MSAVHAQLGASSAHRWMQCPGSIRMSADIEAPTSVYAEEGTQAHWLAADRLRTVEAIATGWRPPTLTDAGDGAHALAEVCLRNGYGLNPHVIDPAMAEHVQLYVDTVRAELEPGDTLWVEQRVSIDRLSPPVPMFGTADSVIYKRASQRLHVFDFKYGAGVLVEAQGNPQGRYYALGAAFTLTNEPITEVEIVICQPRIRHWAGPVRRERISAYELIEWSADLLDAADRALVPNAPLNPGSHCKFCPATDSCPAYAAGAVAIAQSEFANLPTP